MSVALSENPASVIHSLNLAHNSLDNQGIVNYLLFFVFLIESLGLEKKLKLVFDVMKKDGSIFTSSHCSISKYYLKGSVESNSKRK